MLNKKLYKASNKSIAPVIIFASPYRINGYDKKLVNYFSRSLNNNGFHLLAVDIYGTGDTYGLVNDEYSEEESLFIDELINWVGKQSWCLDKQIGMIGFSYSGFVSLQSATRNKLFGAIAMYAGLNNRDEDVWMMNGLPLLIDLFGYAFSQLPYKCIGRFGKERVKHSDLLLKVKHTKTNWNIIHPHSIKTPIFCVGGWADTYVGSCFDIYENNENSKMIIGPWDHVLPSSNKIMSFACMFLNKANIPSCRIFMYDYIRKETSWWESHNRIKPTKHTIKIKESNLEISYHKNPLLKPKYLYTTNKIVLKSLDIPFIEVNLPKNIKNICGRIFLNITCGEEFDPLMVYIFIKTKEHSYYPISICPYNQLKNLNNCTSTGIIIHEGMSIVVAFELNTFPYIWRIPRKNVLKLSDVKITLHFSEYRDLVLKTCTKNYEQTKSSSYLVKNGIITIKDNNETMHIKETIHNICIENRTKYKDSFMTTYVCGDGKNYNYNYELEASNTYIKNSGEWRFQ